MFAFFGGGLPGLLQVSNINSYQQGNGSVVPLGEAQADAAVGAPKAKRLEK